jgi:hypothetical protein
MREAVSTRHIGDKIYHFYPQTVTTKVDVVYVRG